MFRWIKRLWEVKESAIDIGFGTVPDPGLANHNFFRQWIGIYQLVDRMARARGGNAAERPLDDRMLYIARGLMRYNPYAQGFVNALRTYTLGPNGLRHHVVGPSAQKVKDYLTRFKKDNDWWAWEREIYERVHIEGESITRFWPEDGVTVIRPIEPEWLVPRDGTEEWTYGIYNEPDDVCSQTALHTMYGRIREVVDGNDWHMIKSKLSVRSEKRGRSDFLPVAQLLDDSYKVWRNFLQSEAVRQSIVYFSKQAEGVTAADLEQAIAAQTDYKPPNNVSGKGGDPIALKYGSGIEYLPNGTELAAPPGSANVQGTMTGVNAGLLAIGRAYHMPLVLISGDMSANNTLDFSDVSPFGMSIQDEQHWYCRHIQALLWRVVEIGVEEHGLPREALYDGTSLQVTAQRQVSANPFENTQRNKTLYDDGVISARERSTQEGFDYDEQQAQRKREGAKSPSQMAAAAAAQTAPTETKPGLVKKKLTIVRKGKVYQESRMVRPDK